MTAAASDTAQRPLDQCDCFDRLRPPNTSRDDANSHIFIDAGEAVDAYVYACFLEHFSP